MPCFVRVLSSFVVHRDRTHRFPVRAAIDDRPRTLVHHAL